MWRKRVYVILITVAGGLAVGRIFSAELVYEPSLHRTSDQPPYAGRTWPTERPEPMPTFSSNDRSRWATVRALVEEGTFVIGKRDPADVGEDNKYGDTGIVFEDGYGTVDKILHPETREFYSTKPPLLPVLMAGEYWLLHKAFGWTLADNPWLVVRAVLLTFNAVPWVLYLLLVAALAERFGKTDWGRLYVVAAACFGTLLVPFLISVNNHTVAACSCCAAFYFAVRIWEDRAGAWSFALAGLFAGFTACNELPAHAFLVALGLALGWRDPRRTLLVFVPAAMILVAAFFLTNYLALGELLPPYFKFGGPWYEYEGSHWAKANLPSGHPDRRGIDFAADKESRAAYAFHLLLGHHGLFSLTPIFLLALAGMVLAAFWTRREGPDSWRVWGLLGLGLTVIVVGFYLARSTNYGGWTAGPRWLYWLTPLWLVGMVPVADALAGRRWGRGLGLLLLGASALSVAYSLRNPWRHPWIYTFLDEAGHIPY